MHKTRRWQQPLSPCGAVIVGIRLDGADTGAGGWPLTPPGVRAPCGLGVADGARTHPGTVGEHASGRDDSVPCVLGVAEGARTHPGMVGLPCSTHPGVPLGVAEVTRSNGALQQQPLCPIGTEIVAKEAESGDASHVHCE